MRAGPTRPMDRADWAETPYVNRRQMATMPTRPLGRAFHVMDALVADVGLPPTAAAPEPRITATRAKAERAAQSAGFE